MAISMFDLKRAAVLLITVFAASCTHPEPPFTVSGDAMITKDIKVNIEMIKDKVTTIKTVYNNGRRYDIKNQHVLRYIIYVSYKNLLFYRSEVDNLHGKAKGTPINEILITKKDESISALYRPLKESTIAGGTVLQPSKTFFMDSSPQALAKEKFVTLYQAR
jgi:hypothetical protein